MAYHKDVAPQPRNKTEDRAQNAIPPLCLQSILESLLSTFKPQLASLSLLVIPRKLDAQQHDDDDDERVGANGDVQPVLVVRGVLCPENGGADDTADTSCADDCGGGECTFL